MKRDLIAVAVLCSLFSCLVAEAVPAHYEHLRAALMAKAVTCSACHTDDTGTELNLFGQRLHDLDSTQPMAERLAELAGKVSRDSADGERPALTAETDVDQDGVANWVEILAHTSPADAESKPDEAMVDRVYAVVACTTCHEALNVEGKRGLEGNPHNELGKLLAKTFALERGEDRPKGKEEMAEAAAHTPILARWMKIRKKKPKDAEASYWEQLRLLHNPTDPEDMPSAEELEAFQANVKAQKKKDTRDPALGMDTKAHKLDGFLEDAAKLD